MARKKLISLDFDGVIHSYTSGWQGADVIPDGPVPGAMSFLRALVEDGRFEVVIHSSRCSSPAGMEAIRAWLAKHLMRSAPLLVEGGIVERGDPSFDWKMEFEVQEVPGFDGRAIYQAIRVVDRKPPAHVTLDDRALNFDGTWPELDELAAFVPWNKRTPNQIRRAEDRRQMISDVISEALDVYGFGRKRIDHRRGARWTFTMTDGSKAFEIREEDIPIARDEAKRMVSAIRHVWQETRKSCRATAPIGGEDEDAA